MKNITDYILESNYRTYYKAYEQYLLDEIHVALCCFQKTDIGFCPYYSPQIFEYYNFNNCGNVLKAIIEYIESLGKDIFKHPWSLDCKKYEVFFDKLQISFIKDNKMHGEYVKSKGLETTLGGYVKSKSKKKSVYIKLFLLDKNIDEYSLKELQMLYYTIIHELCHAYNDYLLFLGGKQSIRVLMKGKYAQEYKSAIKWLQMIRNDKDYKKGLARCKYYLDEAEKFAYLGTVKETVKNVFNKIKPTYEDLKFDEILDLFKDEYVWSEYMHINMFIDSLDELDKDKLVFSYKILFHKDIGTNELIEELKEKWDSFRKEFINEFIEAYADCAETMQVEHYRDPIDVFENFN